MFFTTVSVDSPLYIRPHSKAVLNAAILADTDFLSRHLVMDYSLLVGLNESTKELVVGIIGMRLSSLPWLEYIFNGAFCPYHIFHPILLLIPDYIRTFTWDKKLEYVFKNTYSQLGGQGLELMMIIDPLNSSSLSFCLCCR